MTSPVTRTSEAVSSGEGRQAYESWRDRALVAQLFETAAEPDTFRHDMRRWWFGDVPVASYSQSPASYVRSRERARADGVDALWVQTIETGALRGSSSGRDVRMTDGMAALCDLGRAAEQRTLPSEGWVVVLPREAFDGRTLDALHGATVDGARHQMLTSHLRWLVEAPEPMAGLDTCRLSTSTAAVVSACLAPNRAIPEAAAPALALATVRRAIAYIDARLDDRGLDVAAVASAVGVSRASLYRACAGSGGVAALIWERRLQAALLALNDPTRRGRLVVIAAECGFASASYFSTRFKDRFGFSPKNLRPF